MKSAAGIVKIAGLIRMAGAVGSPIEGALGQEKIVISILVRFIPFPERTVS